jgi:hypothetical protein
MSEDSPKCRNCGGSTTRGFLADVTRSSYFVAKWVEGEPVKASLFGLQGDNVEIGGRRQFMVRSLRCEQCGLLEFYGV